MKITQANAERFVRVRYPRAKCIIVRGFDGSRDYMVYREGGRAGEMYIAYAASRGAAWKAAALALQGQAGIELVTEKSK